VEDAALHRIAVEAKVHGVTFKEAAMAGEGPLAVSLAEVAMADEGPPAVSLLDVAVEECVVVGRLVVEASVISLQVFNATALKQGFLGGHNELCFKFLSMSRLMIYMIDRINSTCHYLVSQPILWAVKKKLPHEARLHLSMLSYNMNT
jgi:hypothetical protein